ncbi:HD domain-containing protein [Thalassotalea sp. G20_0]|uniref:HD domain-containing protein n=1 Tax=Thalassotalea sp. G20_0 TaxID=2821093 RepID=UPI001ADB7984|nr:HD domain-containing protein [Thalassotalea sp. G20_0]MBO9495181.1 HD domain-containing protein [Thalassotalea sp. G20_0]
MSVISSRLGQQLAFIKELDKLKAVYRKTMVKPDNSRQENSAEHSWHIAVQAMTLQEYAEEPVDIGRVIKMLLLHDIVEIDAGDTFAFAGTTELAGQATKEMAAAERLFGLLPQEQADEFRALWLEFEQVHSPDARFAKAMDCLLPVIQNMDSEGGTWAKYQVTRSQVLRRNQYLEHLAPKLWRYVLEQIDHSVRNGWLQDC